jgi:hypothetical protein
MTITVHTPGNKAVAITLSRHYSSVALDCHISELGLKVRAFNVLPLKAPKQGATHYLDAYKHAIGLDAANAKAVQDAIADFLVDYQQSAEGQREALQSERRNLQDEIVGWWDAMDEAKEKAFAADTGAGWEKVKEYEEKAVTAKVVLEAFDRAHPEIVAEITAAKDAATARFLATD